MLADVVNLALGTAAMLVALGVLLLAVLGWAAAVVRGRRIRLLRAELLSTQEAIVASTAAREDAERAAVAARAAADAAEVRASSTTVPRGTPAEGP